MTAEQKGHLGQRNFLLDECVPARLKKAFRAMQYRA